MKNKKLISPLVLLSSSVLLFSFLVNANLKRTYKPGDFIKEENAYFVKKVTDETGRIKAHKYTTPTDSKYNDQKTRSLGSDLIGDIESVWSSYTGKGTTIAIIDDGFDYDHPEYKRADNSSAILSTSRSYFLEEVEEDVYELYYANYSDDPTCIAEDWEDTKWATHGTNTSTTAAAPMNNGGGVGIAPDADILALKIDFSFDALEAAIDYAVDQGVDVINMSLGAYSESFYDGFGDWQKGSSGVATYLSSVCQKAYNAGIIVVAAAGNEATYHKSYPACNSHVIGVGAIGDYDNKGNATTLAEFTNYVDSSQTGEINVDILAPGYVYTATQGGSSQSSHTHIYDDTQGTSFSSPIVAGAAALWKEKYPNGTPDQFLSDLQSSADGIGYYTNKMVPISAWDDVGPSNITNGRLNVYNLLNYGDDPTPGPGPDPEPVDSFEITFKTGSGDGSTLNSSILEENYLTAGGEYISEIALASKAYYAGDYGLKLGASSNDGDLTLTLSEPLNVTSIVAHAKLYNQNKATDFSINGRTSQSVTADWSDLTFDINETMYNIPLHSSRYMWLSGITVNLASQPETISVESVSLDQTELNLTVDDGAQLTATVLPEDATNKNVSWTSSNESVASVDETGLVVAGEEGTSTITVTTEDGGKTAECLVTVTAPVVPPQPVTGDYEKITESSELEDGDYLIVYEGGNVAFDGGLETLDAVSDTINVTITDDVIESTTTTDAAKFTINAMTGGYSIRSASGYYIGQDSDANGMKTRETEPYANAISFDASGNADIVSSSAHLRYNSASNQLRFRYYKSSSYTGQKAIQLYKLATSEPVEGKVIDSLVATYSGSDIFVGGSLDTSKVSVTAKFTDSEKYPDEVLSSSDYQLSGFDSASAGQKTVTVTYTGSLDTYTSPLTTTFKVTVVEDTLSYIEAFGIFNYYVGEKIFKEDIEVTAHYESGATKEVTDFTFEDDEYRFTYADAPSGGVSKEKEFTVSYGGKSATFTVGVSREAYEEPQAGLTDTLNLAKTGRPVSQTYGNWENKTDLSGVVYAGNSAGDKNSIQLRSNKNESGIVATSSTSKLYKVTVTWHEDTAEDRVLQIYAKNTAYTDATDLYDSNKQGELLGTIVKGTSTEFVIKGDYQYIGLRSASGAMYLSEIKIAYKSAYGETAYNVSNYIMYEDTNGQCVNKLPIALEKLNNMPEDEKNAFWNSDASYVINTARDRLEAWARNQGKVLTLTNDEFVLAQGSHNGDIKTSNNSNSVATIVFIISIGLVTSCTIFIILKKRKEDR